MVFDENSQVLLLLLSMGDFELEQVEFCGTRLEFPDFLLHGLLTVGEGKSLFDAWVLLVDFLEVLKGPLEGSYFEVLLNELLCLLNELLLHCLNTLKKLVNIVLGLAHTPPPLYVDWVLQFFTEDFHAEFFLLQALVDFGDTFAILEDFESLALVHLDFSLEVSLKDI